MGAGGLTRLALAFKARFAVIGAGGRRPDRAAPFGSLDL
jgi:hypothetical protein